MTAAATNAFRLPDHLVAKADPTLIERDEQQFAAIAGSVSETAARPAASGNGAGSADGVSARSMIEASAPTIIAADRPRTLACAVKNCLKRSGSESNRSSTNLFSRTSESSSTSSATSTMYSSSVSTAAMEASFRIVTSAISAKTT